MHEKHVIVTCDFRRPLDDDPMLGAMKMLLQRKPFPVLHHYSLYLVARPVIDLLIIPPRAVGSLMLHDLAAVFAAQPVNKLFDVVSMRLVEHEHGILGGHDDDIVHPNDSRQMLI